MSIAQHLVEIRNRLAWIAGSIIAGSVVGWFVTPMAWNALREPVITSAAASERYATIAFTSVTSAFELNMRIAVTLGVILSSPVWLYQVLAFVAPGLKRREKRFVFGFLLASVPLFVAGCAAGWVVMPHIVAMMTGFASSQDSTVLTASDYLDFVLKLVLAVGIAFVLPVFLVVLNFAQILRGRTILNAWRVAIILICVFTAIATPAADVLSMFILAAPMVVLYFTAVGVALLNDRRHDKREAELLSTPPTSIGA
jgi:sec-independent protein translocase protein TatC